MRASEHTQAAFADAVNVAAFFLTNSCTLNGSCPVAILATSHATWIAQAVFVLAALIWLIPDRRIEKRLAT